MVKIYEEAPDSKLIPEMIRDDEVPAFADDLIKRESSHRLKALQDERKSKPGNTRASKLLATGATVVALAGGAYAVGKAAPDEKPRTPDKVQLYNQHGIKGSTEIISGTNATPEQVYAQQVEDNGGQLPEAP